MISCLIELHVYDECRYNSSDDLIIEMWFDV